MHEYFLKRYHKAFVVKLNNTAQVIDCTYALTNNNGSRSQVAIEYVQHAALQTCSSLSGPGRCVLFASNDRIVGADAIAQ